ncbi:MAG: hypothetical protein WA755_04755 [Candidatus Acidiferrales bacterium]
MDFRQIWQTFTSTRYTRSLEDEIIRLRAENRALVNSIIGIAGIPPLKIDQDLERVRRRNTPRANGTTLANDATIAAGAGMPARERANNFRSAAASAANDAQPARARGIMLPVNPTRRRSWQQIGRMLEIEDARRLLNRDNSDAMS